MFVPVLDPCERLSKDLKILAMTILKSKDIVEMQKMHPILLTKKIMSSKKIKSTLCQTKIISPNLRVYQPIGSMLVKTNQTFSLYLIDYLDQHAINCFGLHRPGREITGWSLRYGTFQKMVLHR